MLHIRKHLGDSAAIADFSLRLKKGSIHGVAGASGAGKTALARILSGQLPPDSGSIVIDGEEIPVRSPKTAAAWGIGIVGEESPYVPGLSLIDHLVLGSEFSPGGKLRMRAAPMLRA